MKLTIKRTITRNSYTLGKLYIDGVYFCDTLEDRDRGLTQNMSVEQIKSIKVPGETAIPKGTYRVTLDVVSPKFSKYPFYMETCGGKLPRLIDVKGYEGVLIHVADGPKRDSLVQGCIGVGNLSAEEYLMNGKKVFAELYNKLKGNNIELEIV
jgi:hypothetical protein|nr:MAG TPA: Protein of unknown function (DUF2778) [Crassvirales sp.]